MPRIRVPVLVLCLVATSAVPAQAQEFLRPLSEYVAQYVSNPENTETLRYVARRCGVTLLVVSTLPEAQAQPGVVENYSSTSTAFINLALMVEESNGLEPEQALEATQNEMEDIGVAVRARLDRNAASTGSYLADDLLLRDDIAVCTGLSARLKD